MRSVGVLDQPHQRAVGIDQVADPQAARLQLRSFEARPAGAFFLGSRRVHQCHHGIEIIQPQATAERARSWVEVRIGEEFELQTAALQDHPAAILPTRRKAQLRIKRLCHIEIARWQIGGDVVSHGSAQLVGHAGRMSDCGAAIGAEWLITIMLALGNAAPNARADAAVVSVSASPRLPSDLPCCP